MTDASGAKAAQVTELAAVPDPATLVRDHPMVCLGPGGGIAGRGVAAWTRAADLDEAAAWVGTHLPGPGAHIAPRALVSIPFDAATSAWPITVVVPADSVVVRDGRAWRVRLPAAAAPRPLVTPPTADDTLPGGDRFRDAVRQAVRAIRAGELSKVVLASAVEVACPHEAQSIAHELAVRYPGCWCYLLDGLVGASPELLIRRVGTRASARVLAGTVPQGEHTATLLAEAMTAGGKNRREHALAVASAVASLTPFTTTVRASPEPYALHLPNVAHLASDVTAEVRSGVDIWDLLAAIHPTAAVCGTPTASARERLRAWEGFDRGRYAGPVGWCDATGDGEFAIALRGGQVHGARIRLYAGAGIVDGSDPDDEWQEVQHKLRPMREAIAEAQRSSEATA